MKKFSAPFSFLVFSAIFAAGVFAQTPESKKPAEAKTPRDPAPTVRQILDRYVTALGGRDAITKVKSRVSRGSVELIPMNLKGSFESFTAAEASSYSKISISGIGDMLEGSDGKAGWSINPIQGTRDKTGLELAQTKLINDFYRDIRLEKLFPKIELTGSDTVGGRGVWVIKGTPEGLPPETWYFDKETGLMLKSQIAALTPVGDMPITTGYEDYRKVDGVMVPFRIRQQTTQFEIILNLAEMTFGANIDQELFKKPRAN